jgi:hypothetical protein
MTTRRQPAPAVRGSGLPDRIGTALATKPTARGRWVLLPVDTDEGERPPRLEDGEEYRVVTATGGLEDGVWVQGPRAWGWEVDAEPADVVAVWIPSRSGQSRTEQQIRTRWESIKLRLNPGYKARLAALAAAVGYSISTQVEALIDYEELIREAHAGRPK